MYSTLNQSTVYIWRILRQFCITCFLILLSAKIEHFVSNTHGGLASSQALHCPRRFFTRLNLTYRERGGWGMWNGGIGDGEWGMGDERWGKGRRVEDEIGMGGNVEKTLREWHCTYPESFVSWKEVSTRFVLPWNRVSSVLPLEVANNFSLCLILQGLETRADWKQKLKQILQHGSNSQNTQDNLLRICYSCRHASSLRDNPLECMRRRLFSLLKVVALGEHLKELSHVISN